MPGTNKVTVVNGSAHGVGIYTAHVEQPRLSLGFARDTKSLLICGVLDDAVTTAGVVGNYALKAESKSIRRGDSTCIGCRGMPLRARETLGSRVWSSALFCRTLKLGVI